VWWRADTIVAAAALGKETIMRAQMLINGSWRDARDGYRMDVIDPATEETIASVPAAGSSDVEEAVRAARAAFDRGAWPRFDGAARAKVLRAIAARIADRRAEIACIEVRDNGKPLAEAEFDVADAAACFEFYAGLAEQYEGQEETITVPDRRFLTKVVREPLGVAAAIIPWNFPLLMAAWKVAPALAAGCTMVLKPSELTPLTALELGAIAQESGLPDGVLNILTGFGPEAGEPLATHKAIDKIAFTGSVPIGSLLMKAAAEDIKRISLELGGKSPFIVFGDSDVEKAVDWIMFGVFLNQGQVCTATSRVLVQSSIYQNVLERLTEESRKIKIGNGLDPSIKLGPLVSDAHLAKVKKFIAQGQAEGAKLTSGGRHPAGINSGYFLEPTVFADVPTTSAIWTDEIFGPVVSLRPFETEEEAVRLANHSAFGLAAAVMSADRERTNRVAASLQAGIVWVNCSQPAFVQAPWGGYKKSGVGRELGRWGLESYLETKQITRFDSDERWGWYQ
jgi:betaine-aldehyde dehydrogenase